MIKNIKVRAAADKPYSDYVQYLNSTITLPTEFQYVAIDLFAGCGGLSLGFEAAGIKTLGYEMDKDCCKTYNENLNGECVCEKLTTDTVFPNVDIVIGGPPCQPFSVSGKQRVKPTNETDFRFFYPQLEGYDPKYLCLKMFAG